MDPSAPPLSDVLCRPPLPWVLLAFSCLFGLLWGSFFNVCIYRLPMGLSPNRPRRSFCFSCGSPIAWYDNIPLLSWLALGGRCRQCGTRIPFRYFAIEAITGAIFALLWWRTNGPAAVQARGTVSVAFVWYWAVTGFLIIGTMTDIDHWIIPDGITRGGLVTALVAALILPQVSPDVLIARAGPFPAVRQADLSDPVDAVGALLGISPDHARGGKVWSRAGRPATGPSPAPGASRFSWWEPLGNAAAGAVVGYGLLWGIAILGRLVFRREAMGGGDLKLFGFLGAVFGPFNVIVLLFLSSLVGVAMGLGAMVWSAVRPPRSIRLADLLTTPQDAPSPDVGTPRIDAAGMPPAEAREDEVPAPGGTLGSEPEPEEHQRDRAIEEYLIYARKRPAPRRVHHIPFGPSIGVAALFLLIWNEPIHRVLTDYLLPAFGR